jgi:hypothetical protein
MRIFIAIIVICFIAMLVYYFASQGRKMMGTATVVSRRLELSSMGSKWADNYNRLITFRLSDSSELELYVTKEAYAVLQDGETGQLVWQGDQLLSFDSDI